jgi:hypothetical protein
MSDKSAMRTQVYPAGIVGTAPLNLIYVAHGERMRDVSPEDRKLLASVDAGFIGQNVYLFCASKGRRPFLRRRAPQEARGGVTPRA